MASNDFVQAMAFDTTARILYYPEVKKEDLGSGLDIGLSDP
jgi:hypothetical protein